MEQHKTYTCKHKKTNHVWQFKYDLTGNFISFEILTGHYDKKVSEWLCNGRFPYNEQVMKDWIKWLKQYFDIEILIPEITFDYFYELYGKKVTKKQSFDFWKKKMKKGQHLLAVLGIKRYKSYCQNKGQDLLDPIRYLKNERYLDEN